VWSSASFLVHFFTLGTHNYTVEALGNKELSPTYVSAPFKSAEFSKKCVVTSTLALWPLSSGQRFKLFESDSVLWATGQSQIPVWPIVQDQTLPCDTVQSRISYYFLKYTIRLHVVAHWTESETGLWPTAQSQTLGCGPKRRVSLRVVGHSKESNSLLWPTVQSQTLHRAPRAAQNQTWR
jgi:hypothetical protein